MICRSCTSHGVFADGLRFYSLLVVFSAPPRRHRAFQKYKEQIERLYEKLERSHPSAAGWRGLGSTCGRLSGLWRDSDNGYIRVASLLAMGSSYVSNVMQCSVLSMEKQNDKVRNYEYRNIRYCSACSCSLSYHVSSWSLDLHLSSRFLS